MKERDPRQSVRIVDLDMPFGSMVRFMVKWAIAAIPALIILMVIGAIVGASLAGVTRALVTRSSSGTTASTDVSSLTDSILSSLSSPSSTAPSWFVNESVNPIDDSPTVTLTLDASSPSSSTYGGSPTIVLRCKSRKTELYINWRQYLGLEATSVTLRLGRAPASTRSWTLSTDNQATFYPGNAVSFMKELIATDTLVASTTPYSESPVTAIFAVTGLPEKISALREACRW